MKSSKSAVKSKKEKTKDLLTRGVDEVIERASLEKKLASGKKLRVKLGIDPTSPDLHLGHSVVLRKMRHFQDLGHKAVLIIGDFTGRVGDPSGRSKERNTLTKAEVQKNMKKYLEQAEKIIDIQKVEVRYNSEWLGKNVEDILELTKAGTVQQVLARQDFQERIKKNQKVSILETLYPLLQGYDSVKVKADVELGGTDQLLNLLMGRHVQRYFDMTEQDVVTVPLIEGTDGSKKMSKSKNNYIALNEKPKEMYGKIMSINDNLITKYFALCTDRPNEEIIKIENALKAKKLNPRSAKADLAREIVSIYHNPEKAEKAEAEFNRVFQSKKLPTKIPTFTLKQSEVHILDLMIQSGLAQSKNEASRLIKQGGVRVGDEKILDPQEVIRITKQGVILQVGKRRFKRAKRA